MSTIPEKHNLSGIYFRYKNPVTGQTENRVFEDFPEEDMRALLINRKEEWLQEMVVIMARCLHTIADQLQVYSGTEDVVETFNVNDDGNTEV